MTSREPLEATLRATRVVIVALVAGPAALVIAGAVFDLGAEVPAIAATLTTLAGLVAPAIAWRLYGSLRGRAAASAAPAERAQALRNAIVVALAVTEFAAILGALAFATTRNPAPLVAPAMHAILAGAVWPTRERFDAVVAGDGPGAA